MNTPKAAKARIVPLNRSCSGWKECGVHGATLRTALDLGLMFGDFHPHRRNVEDLAPFIAVTGADRQRRLALGTVRHRVALNMLRLRHRLELMPGMPSLGARFLAAGASEAA